MTRILLGLLLLLVTSFSQAEDEVTGFEEMDEIQEIIDQNQKIVQSHKNIFPALGLDALKDPRIKDKISKQFDESNISLMSLEKKIKYFNEHYEGNPLKGLLDKVPKIRDIFVDVITDKKSILGLLSIFQKEKERLYALYIIIGLFILNILLRKLIIGPEAGFFSRFILRMTISFFCSLLTIGSLYYLFQKELSPIVEVVKSHF
ncbi:MAG TPA: hypothetical protein VKZ84_07035 [Bacteriovoracaceae bacterium]|nr:hypothetical protein [Bacteriovoracaceae bacterium]